MNEPLPVLRSRPSTDTDQMRALTGAIQVLTVEIRELNRRIAWVQPATTPVTPVTPITAATTVRPGSMRVHTPKGPAAQKRVIAIRARLGLKTRTELAGLLGVSAAMVDYMERGMSGISESMHEKLSALEQGRRVE